MGQYMLPSPLLLLALTCLTLTEGQYYDTFQGLQQFFPPYQRPVDFFSPHNENRYTGLRRQTNRQENRRRDQEEERYTKKPLLEEYGYHITTTTPKPSRKTTKNYSSQSNKQNNHRNFNTDIVFSDDALDSSYFEQTTKRNNNKATKTTTSNNFYERATTENSFGYANNNRGSNIKPVTENVFEKQYPKETYNTDDYGGNSPNDRRTDNSDYNNNFNRPANNFINQHNRGTNNNFDQPTNNRNPDVHAVGSPNKHTQNNRRNNFGSTSGFINTDNNSNRGTSNNRGTTNDRGTAYDSGTFNNRGTTDTRGTTYDRGTSYDKGTTNDRGTNYDRGTNNDRGTAYDSGTFNNRGSSNDRGTYNDRGTINDKGTTNNRGTNYDRGTTNDRGTGYDTGTFNNRGSSSERETSNNRGTSYDRGTNNDRGTTNNRGTNYDRGTTNNRGTGYDSGTANNRGTAYDSGTSNNRGSSNDRGTFNNRGSPNYSTNRGILMSDYAPTQSPNYDNNPLLNRPGVKPVPVDVNQPPITNKPVTNNPYDDGFGRNSDKTGGDSPETMLGPDEEDMTEGQKRQYLNMAEKMCDRYKSIHQKEVVALPLLPAPDPVQVNVSSCVPITAPLVIGGRVASINEFPHMALVGWKKISDSGYSWKCGGSLISSQHVLTAGHCTYQDKDYEVESGPPQAVQLGSSYLDDPNAVVIRISAAIRHPKYKQRRSYYDIAVLKLSRTVKFSETIRPACLGVPPGIGKKVIATGWGRTEFGGDHSVELRSVSLPVWNMAECREIWGTSLKLPNGPSPDSHMCAGEKAGGKDTCQGDSGGPAQIQDGCVWRVVAVTSYGRSCGAPNTPALYAITQRVFIAAVMFGNDEQTRPAFEDREKPSYNRPSARPVYDNYRRY